MTQSSIYSGLTASIDSKERKFVYRLKISYIFPFLWLVTKEVKVIFEQENRPKKRNNQVVQAEVIEIDETTTPRASKLDRFREAYGSYFASSAQRSAQRFGDSFKRLSAAGIDEDDFAEAFDQVKWIISNWDRGFR
jgi:hypothetical protein